jgi:NTP pyrophosphatase (non-canonical NTP hydrolase)
MKGYYMNLTFKKLSRTNKHRCRKAFHSLKSWTETDWACALAGEVGELCNFIKKRRRRPNKKEMARLKHEVAKEMSDVVCYLDLLASRMGIDLEKAIIEKFNEVSDRKGSKIKL